MIAFIVILAGFRGFYLAFRTDNFYFTDHWTNVVVQLSSKHDNFIYILGNWGNYHWVCLCTQWIHHVLNLGQDCIHYMVSICPYSNWGTLIMFCVPYYQFYLRPCIQQSCIDWMILPFLFGCPNKWEQDLSEEWLGISLLYTFIIESQESFLLEYSPLLQSLGSSSENWLWSGNWAMNHKSAFWSFSLDFFWFVQVE
jgi:hypothetical protein